MPSQGEASFIDSPERTPLAARYIISVSAEEKIAPWPEFSNANEVAILTDDFS